MNRENPSAILTVRAMVTWIKKEKPGNLLSECRAIVWLTGPTVRYAGCLGELLPGSGSGFCSATAFLDDLPELRHLIARESLPVEMQQHASRPGFSPDLLDGLLDGFKGMLLHRAMEMNHPLLPRAPGRLHRAPTRRRLAPGMRHGPPGTRNRGRL